MTIAQYDVEEFESVLNHTVRFLEEKRSETSDWLTHIKAFGGVTLDLLINQHKPQDEIRFTYDDLWEFFHLAKYQSQPTEVVEAADKIRGFEKTFKDTLANLADEYVDYLVKNNCAYKLNIAVQKGGGSGNKSKRYFVLDPIVTNPLNQSSIKMDENIQEIEYKLVQLPQLNYFARWLSKIELTGWKRWVYVSIPIVILVEAYFAFFAFVQLQNINLGILATLLFTVNLCCFLPFGAYFSLTNSRVSEAPFWILPLSVRTGQLVSIPITNKARSARKIELRIYQAECPICGAEVDVVSGKGEFKKRLIGQCFEAGNEHIFSFDHVTKKGVPLRSNGYYKVHKLSKNDNTD